MLIHSPRLRLSDGLPVSASAEAKILCRHRACCHVSHMTAGLRRHLKLEALLSAAAKVFT